ncbi:TPA: hypothetical protein KFR56_002208 [Escherichia coli]|uniref:hypothetical protein n=2 Tax=Escherichia coli TaxID=562 RepID=UPI00069B6DCC|nr:hypothetical protein [Escherichia coli]HBC9902959.1 hypothetical protein [Escherichia coli]
MFTLLTQFFVAFFIATFKRFLPFLGKLLPWVSDNFRVISYVTFSVGLFVTLIRSSNEVIDLVSSSGVVNGYLRIGFSYLPDNISRCVNIVFATEFSAYVYQYKNKIIKMLFDRVIFKG